MKKPFLLRMVLVAFAFAALCLLTGAAKASSVHAQYELTAIGSDGEWLPAADYLPGGGMLTLYEGGSGILQLEEQTCSVTWASGAEGITLQIRLLQASGTEKAGGLLLEFDGLGTAYWFSADASTEPPADFTDAENASAPDSEAGNGMDISALSAEQQRWYGLWEGRLWFSNAGGEWADYETRTMAVTASVRIDSTGKGTLEVWNDVYSGDAPMLELALTFDGTGVSCGEGYMMSYPIAAGEVSATCTQEDPDGVESTVIMHPGVWEYGHYYELDEEATAAEAAEPETVDVLRITGSCADAAGGFDYKIVLTRPETVETE